MNTLRDAQRRNVRELHRARERVSRENQILGAGRAKMRRRWWVALLFGLAWACFIMAAAAGLVGCGPAPASVRARLGKPSPTALPSPVVTETSWPGAPAVTNAVVTETATAAPAAVTKKQSPAPTAGPVTCEVSTSYTQGTVNVREGPGMDFTVVDVVREGETLTLIGLTSGGWAAVRTPGGVYGWFYQERWCQ